MKFKLLKKIFAYTEAYEYHTNTQMQLLSTLNKIMRKPLQQVFQHLKHRCSLFLALHFLCIPNLMLEDHFTF